LKDMRLWRSLAQRLGRGEKEKKTVLREQDRPQRVRGKKGLSRNGKNLRVWILWSMDKISSGIKHPGCQSRRMWYEKLQKGET